MSRGLILTNYRRANPVISCACSRGYDYQALWALGLALRNATPELALLELTSEVKQNLDLEVQDKLFESVAALHPLLLMKLLKACHPVKAERLNLC